MSACRERIVAVGAAAICVAAAVIGPHSVRADSVTDDRGVFGDVTILGLSDGNLTFRFEDGRILERPVLDVRAVTLPMAADPAADELSRAEALRRANRPGEAAPLYERCRAASPHAWLREYATYRLIEACDAAGRFADAADCYLALAERHPALVRACVPRHAPRRGSADAERVLKRLDALSAKRQTASVSEAAERLRRVLGGETAADERASATRKALKPPAGHVRTARRAKYQVKGLRITAGVYKAMEAGKSDEARGRIEKGLKAAKESDRDVWWLAEAEYQLAVGDATKGSLAAMKVYALCPDSPYVAEALLLAGEGYERLRPSKAASLYEMCMRHPTATPMIRKRAEERRDAMAHAAASQAAASRPS